MAAFCIVPTEAALAVASKLFKDYTVTTLHAAKSNGIRASIEGQRVLCWATEDSYEAMHELAVGLALICPEVKEFDIDPLMPMQAFESFKDVTKYLASEKKEGRERLKLVTIDKLAVINNGEDAAVCAVQGIADESQPQPSHSSPPLNADSPDFGPDAPPSSTAIPDPVESAPFPPVEAYQDEFPWHSSQLSPELAHSPYRSHAEAVGAAEWPQPLDLTKSLYRGKPMPLDLVPVPLQPFVEDCRKRLGTPAGPVWFGLLGAIAGLAPDHVRLQPKQFDTDWTVHPCVWPLVIGGPSSGKTPAFEIGMRYVQKKDMESVLENTKKMKEHAHQMDIYADECVVARKNKMPLPALSPAQEEPILREYWVSRGTTEGVTRLLQHSAKVVWYSDEASSTINSLDRYAAAGKGSGDREFVLQLYNGGPTKNTLAGKTISIRNGSAVLCGGTTPTAMLSAAGGKLQKDGLLARMLFCMVPDMVQGTDTVPDAEAAATYNQVLSNLIDMTGAATVNLSPAAIKVYKEFCTELHHRIKSEDSEYLTGTLGKWFGTWARLALIYWLTDCAAHGQLPLDGDEIGEEIANQVSAFMWWQLGHQQQFWYEIMADKAGRKFSQIIARYILAHPDLIILNFRNHIARPHHEAMEKLKPWEIKEGINTLITAAWLAPQGQKINSHGVPSSYDINPNIRTMFEDEREDEIQRRTDKRNELQGLRREPGSDD